MSATLMGLNMEFKLFASLNYRSWNRNFAISYKHHKLVDKNLLHPLKLVL